MGGRCLERCGVDGVVQQERYKATEVRIAEKIRDDAGMFQRMRPAKEALQDK